MGRQRSMFLSYRSTFRYQLGYVSLPGFVELLWYIWLRGGR